MNCIISLPITVDIGYIEIMPGTRNFGTNYHYICMFLKIILYYLFEICANSKKFKFTFTSLVLFIYTWPKKYCSYGLRVINIFVALLIWQPPRLLARFRILKPGSQR